MSGWYDGISTGSAALQNVLNAGQNLQNAYSSFQNVGNYLSQAGATMSQYGKDLNDEAHKAWARDYQERNFKHQQNVAEWEKTYKDAAFAYEVEKYNLTGKALEEAKTKNFNAAAYLTNMQGNMERIAYNYLKENPNAVKDTKNHYDGKEMEQQNKTANETTNETLTSKPASNQNASKEIIINKKNTNSSTPLDTSKISNPQTPQNSIMNAEGSEINGNLASAAGVHLRTRDA